MASQKKLKILVSAYACEPNKGSEPAVGWNIIFELSKYHFIYVITRSNNKINIKNFIKKNPMPNVYWFYYDLPCFFRFWKKGRRGIQFYYYFWQIGIYFYMRKLLKKYNIDLIHHITLVKYWMPSFLSLLPYPFIWGPVGGGDDTPKNYITTYSFYGRINEYFRIIAKKIFSLDPFLKYTIKKSNIIFASTHSTKKKINKIYKKKIYVLSQVALNKNVLNYLSEKNKNKELKKITFISIGELVPLKAINLSLKAFSKLSLKKFNIEYIIIGDGPEKSRLIQLTKKLAIDDYVFFKGRLPQKDVYKYLKYSDVLIHPSLHDSGGFVVAEGMAASLPIICFDIGGPSILVSEKTGIKIKVDSPQNSIKAISIAMQKLINDKNLREKMGKEGRKRILKKFTWEYKIKIFNKTYYDVYKNYS